MSRGCLDCDGEDTLRGPCIRSRGGFFPLLPHLGGRAWGRGPWLQTALDLELEGALELTDAPSLQRRKKLALSPPSRPPPPTCDSQRGPLYVTPRAFVLRLPPQQAGSQGPECPSTTLVSHTPGTCLAGPGAGDTGQTTGDGAQAQLTGCW